MAFCVKCGASMDDGRFCPMCGADNQPAAQPTPPEQATYAAPAAAPVAAPVAVSVAPQAKSKKGLWITLAILAVLLVVGVVLLFVFQPWNAGQTKEANCDSCGTHGTCRSITYQGETGWFCNECYDWVNSMLNAQNNLGGYEEDYSDYVGDYLDDFDAGEYGDYLDEYNDYVQDYSDALGDYSDYLSDYL